MREIGKRVMKQVRKGNHRAFKKLVEHYHHSVYEICFIIIGDNKAAEDLAKDIFLHVYYHIDDCQVSTEKFSLWLYQKTVTVARTQMKQEDQPAVHAYSARYENAESDIPFILMNVSLRERLALILKSINHLSVQEISEVLDIPNSDTSSYIWRGREMVREMIC